MSEPKDDDAFLSRWSRRKIAAREGESLPEPKPPEPTPAAPAAVTAAEAPAKPDLPPLDSLEGLKSDYRAFMQPGVDEDVKRAAIKKLFADPQFNVMDGLDVYIDDYTNFEPLPAAMLGKIAAVKYLFRAPDPELEPETASDVGEAEDASPSPEDARSDAAAVPEGPAEDAPTPAAETIRTDSAKLEPGEHSSPGNERNPEDS
jgi:hypothetical protein